MAYVESIAQAAKANDELEKEVKVVDNAENVSFLQKKKHA
jgi:hypothetical protein